MTVKSITHFILAVGLMAFASCEQVANFDEAAQSSGSTDTSGATNTSNTGFAGISSISEVTDSTATVNWSHVSGSTIYQLFSISGGSQSFVANITPPTSTYNLTGLTASTSYTYRVRSVDSSGKIDINSNDVTITTLAAPITPISLTLYSPNVSPAFDTTPTVTVGGVKSGDTVKLFTDSSCSTQIGSAVSSGTSVNVTSTTTLAITTHTLYANSTGISGGISACMGGLSYEITSCPNGYIQVPSNAAVGAPNNFCVMQFEAKAWNDIDGDNNIDAGEIDADGCSDTDGCGTAGANWGLATHRPASTAEGIPWRVIDTVSAWNECDSLNSEGGRSDIDSDVNSDGTFALLSNPEWMAIARNVEVQPANWTDGVVSSSAGGCLKRGNQGNNINCTGGVQSYNGPDPDSGTGRADSGSAQLVLDNGEIIWDLSGNVEEMIDWTLGSPLSGVTPANKAFVSGDGAPLNAWRDFADLDSNIAGGDEMRPESWQAVDTTLRKSNIGAYAAHINTVGGAATRGGNWYTRPEAGIYNLTLSTPLSFSDGSTAVWSRRGFRCVYRLP